MCMLSMFPLGNIFGAVLWTAKRKTFSVHGEGGYSERIDGRSVATMFLNTHMVTICSNRQHFYSGQKYKINSTKLLEYK